jgi:hypothetical protein
MLTTLAGDRGGLSMKSFSRIYRLPSDTSLTRGLSGVVANGSSILSYAIVNVTKGVGTEYRIRFVGFCQGGSSAIAESVGDGFTVGGRVDAWDSSAPMD